MNAHHTHTRAYMLSRCRYRCRPHFARRSRALQRSRNGISALPDGVCDALTNLTLLDVSHNAIASLSPHIGALAACLAELDLSHNSLAYAAHRRVAVNDDAVILRCDDVATAREAVHLCDRAMRAVQVAAGRLLSAEHTVRRRCASACVYMRNIHTKYFLTAFHFICSCRTTACRRCRRHSADASRSPNCWPHTTT